MTVTALHTVRDDTRILKGAHVISTTDRAASLGTYVTVKIGVSNGAGVDYYGTYDGTTQDLKVGAPLRVTGASDLAVRIPKNASVVADVTVAGGANVTGLSVQLQVGTSLQFPGHRLTDPSVQAAIDGVATYLRDIGGGDQEFTVPLREDVDLATTRAGIFRARLSLSSATQLSLGAYNGSVVEVNGTLVDVTTAITVSSTTSLINASGTETGSGPGTSTLYYVYVSSSALLRLSATAPTQEDGVYYLTATASGWRFVGWVRTNGSTQFVNDTTDRLVINYYNRLCLPILITPGYNDNNASTTYTTTSTSFTPANGGTGSAGSYIANGEDAVNFHLTAIQVLSGATTYSGIGDNSTTAAYAVAIGGGGTTTTAHASMAYTPAAGYRTVNLLIAVSSGTGTWTADGPRLGSTADPYGTKISGWVMG